MVGDGRVEIELGRRADAVTLGVASDEEKKSGLFHPGKFEKLKKAGADFIIPDFRALEPGRASFENAGD